MHHALPSNKIRGVRALSRLLLGFCFCVCCALGNGGFCWGQAAGAVQELSLAPLDPQALVPNSSENKPEPEPKQAEVGSTAHHDRHLVVLTGLPGDALHRERLTQATRDIASAAESALLVPQANAHFMVGDQKMASEIAEQIPTADVCTSESVPALLQELAARVGKDDTLWVIFLGHAHLVEARSQFNVQGRDFAADQFAQWLQSVSCRRKVLLFTMPVSGMWLKAVRAPGTVGIAATESLGESTATEFPYALADVLTSKQEHQSLSDIDGDGRLSLLDLYLATTLEVHQRYKALERLETEHAQLDDNGDGKGKELQAPYVDQVAVEPEGFAAATARSVKTSIKSLPTNNSDGALARTILIGQPLAAPTPTAE